MPPLEAQEAEIWLERILRCSVPSCRTAHFLSIRVIEISGDLRIESKKKICYFFVAQILREIPRGRLFFTRKAPIQILSDCLYYQTLITLLYRISWGKSKIDLFIAGITLTHTHWHYPLRLHDTNPYQRSVTAL